MKLTSDFAILDVKNGRNKLLKRVQGEGFGPTGRPTGARISVTITGFIVGAYGGDDGTSREFEVEVTDLTVNE